MSTYSLGVDLAGGEPHVNPILAAECIEKSFGKSKRLRQAFAEGVPHSWDIHTWDAEFSPLRNHPDFQELIRPKG